MSEIIKMNENTWRIEDGMVRMFLLTGTKEALLVDSGMCITNAKEIAEGITDLPVKLINTHADGDHIAGNEAFGEFYMHPNEEPNYRFRGKKEQSFRYSKEISLIWANGLWKSLIYRDIRREVLLFWM